MAARTKKDKSETHFHSGDRIFRIPMRKVCRLEVEDDDSWIHHYARLSNGDLVHIEEPTYRTLQHHLRTRQAS